MNALTNFIKDEDGLTVLEYVIGAGLLVTVSLPTARHAASRVTERVVTRAWTRYYKSGVRTRAFRPRASQTGARGSHAGVTAAAIASSIPCDCVPPSAPILPPVAVAPHEEPFPERAAPGAGVHDRALSLVRRRRQRAGRGAVVNRRGAAVDPSVRSQRSDRVRPPVARPSVSRETPPAPSASRSTPQSRSSTAQRVRPAPAPVRTAA